MPPELTPPPHDAPMWAHRVEAKLDRIEERLDRVMNWVSGQEEKCRFMHRRTDEIMSANTARIEKLASNGVGLMLQNARWVGGWKAIAVMAAAASGLIGAGAALAKWVF